MIKILRTEDNERCDNCRFGRAITKGLRKGKIGCHRHAPTVQAVSVRVGADNYNPGHGEWQTRTMSPATPVDHWCGEWEPRSDAIDEPGDDGIREAAIAYVQARNAKDEAKRKRQECHDRCENCEYEAVPDPDGGRSWQAQEGTPCFKMYDSPNGETQMRLPREEWCPACLESQEHHEEYRRQAQRSGVLLRWLKHRVKKAATTEISRADTDPEANR